MYQRPMTLEEIVKVVTPVQGEESELALTEAINKLLIRCFKEKKREIILKCVGADDRIFISVRPVNGLLQLGTNYTVFCIENVVSRFISAGWSIAQVGKFKGSSGRVDYTFKIVT